MGFIFCYYLSCILFLDQVVSETEEEILLSESEDENSTNGNCFTYFHTFIASFTAKNKS